MLQDFETILISLPTTIAIWQKRQTELALTDSLNFPLEKIANIWHAYQQFSIEKFEAMLEIAKHDYTLFDLDLTFAIHSDVNVDSSEFDKILDYVNKLKNEPIFTLEQKKSNLNLLCLYANALLPAYFIFVQTWAQSFQAMLPGIQKKYEAELIAQVKTNFLDKLTI
jgi:hypothetical protein